MLIYRNLVLAHLKNHLTIYIFMIILLLTGIIFGAIIVNSMNFVQKQDLFFYIEQFLEQISNNERVSQGDVFKQSLFDHLKFLSSIFVLGLSMIGLPIIWILLFLKGLVIGFTVGFIVNQLGLTGLFLAALSIAPHNLLIIPIYVVASSLAMIFSLTLFRKLFSEQRTESILMSFRRYVVLFVMFVSTMIVAALLETFIANEAMQSFVKRFY